MVLKCPICFAETTWEENPDRPFCSTRCRMQDLGNWASETYRVSTDEKPDAKGEPDEQG